MPSVLARYAHGVPLDPRPPRGSDLARALRQVGQAIGDQSADEPRQRVSSHKRPARWLHFGPPGDLACSTPAL